jgi:hypothetical protein
LTTQEKIVGILKPPKPGCHHSLTLYEVASEFYKDRWDDEPKSHAWRIGNLRRTMERRPDVFSVFIFSTGINDRGCFCCSLRSK